MRAFFFYSQNQRHNTRAEARRRRPRSGVAKRGRVSGRAEPCSHSHSGLSSHYCIRVVPVSYTSFYWHAEADLLYLKHVFCVVKCRYTRSSRHSKWQLRSLSTVVIERDPSPLAIVVFARVLISERVVLTALALRRLPSRSRGVSRESWPRGDPKLALDHPVPELVRLQPASRAAVLNGAKVVGQDHRAHLLSHVNNKAVAVEAAWGQMHVSAQVRLQKLPVRYRWT